MWYYYHVDGLGSVTMLTRSDKTVANRYVYDDFGGFRSRTEAVTNPYAYTGREYDSAVDLIYYRARYYDPLIGRFLTRDPAGMVDGPNVYVYVGNNPVTHADPTGRGWCSYWQKVLLSSLCGIGATVVSVICGFATGWIFSWTCFVLGIGLSLFCDAFTSLACGEPVWGFWQLTALTCDYVAYAVCHRILTVRFGWPGWFVGLLLCPVLSSIVCTAANTWLWH